MSKGVLILLLLLFGNFAFCQSNPQLYSDYNGTYVDMTGGNPMLYKTNFMGQKEPLVKIQVAHPQNSLPQQNLPSQDQANPYSPKTTTADDIIRQANRNNPYYRPVGDTRTSQQMTQDWIAEQNKNNPAFNPQLRNPNNKQSHFTDNKGIENMLNRAATRENPTAAINKLKSGYYKTPEFAKETKPYTDALQQLKNMLNGKQQLSIANTYFTVENAFGNSYQSQKEFRDLLNRSVAFIKTWMQQNNMNIHSNEDVHLAIQKFIGENLTIRDNNLADKQPSLKSTTHYHFVYDYDDNGGEKDYRNFFLTKCLATGMGQCSSMPAIYLILAEALGVKTYLSTAPQHSFIKYTNNNGNIVNYEPTSNWKISDKWYVDNMAISADAVRNHIYLDTFNKRQIIADQMLSLAEGYMRKYGAADGEFVTECISNAAPQFAHQNIQALLVQSDMLSRMLNASRQYAGINNVEELGKSKEATQLYQALERNEAVITQLGYREMAEDIYNELLKEHEFKGRIQDSLKIDGKQKRSLFIEH